MRKIDIITETFWIKGKFLMDVVVTPEMYEAYIYNTDYDVKDLMFQLPREQQSYREALKIFESSINVYINNYIMDHMHE